MNNQTDIFTLKEVIKPRHTLTSFGYKTKISPDGDTIVVLDCENSFISFYTRSSLGTNSAFIFANQFSKPEFKHQYIITDAIFNENSDRCYVSVKYCDYVNYDLDIRRNSFLVSIIVYIKQTTEVPVLLENTVIYEKRALWSYFVSCPYVDTNAYQIISATSNNTGLYGLTTTYLNTTKLYYQPLNAINNSILYNVSTLIQVDTPTLVGTLLNIRNIQLISYFLGNYIVFNVISSTPNKKLYRRNITPTTIEQEITITDNVDNFAVSEDYVVCNKMGTFEIYNLQTLNLYYTYTSDIIDTQSVLAVSPRGNKVVELSIISKIMKIYQEQNYTYTNNFPYTSAHFDSQGKTLVLGQPKNGRVLIFSNLAGWDLFQELTLDGFSDKFDIDGEEKTLVITNNSIKTTEIYENISYDLSQLQKSIVDISNNVSTIYIEKYFESMTIGYRSRVLDYKNYNSDTPPVSAILNQDIPYYIPSDGNVLFTIYESINEGYGYVYHIYGNDISGNQFESTRNLLIYTQSNESRLKSITTDRRGETVFLLRENNHIEIYKRLNLNETTEIYQYIRTTISDLRDIWNNMEYNSRSKQITKIRFNSRGNILIVEQEQNIIVLHFEQEIMFKQKTIGHPNLGTDVTDENLPAPKYELGNYYIYFRNFYYLFSEPIITYIFNEKFLTIDENENIYTWSGDKIHVYIEDNFYRAKIDTIPFQVLLVENIQFYPEERLFTYKDTNNIYIYYYDKENHNFINTNVVIPNVEKYNIIDHHIIQYKNKNIKIDRYSIDVIQNQNQIDFSLNTVYSDTIYSDTIDTSYNFVDMTMDYKNNINLFYISQYVSRCYHYEPNLQTETKYKHMITFREQKIDVDIQYKHDEFYNNVIQVLPTNYLSDTRGQNTRNSGENEYQFKINCPEKFTYSREINNTEIHTFTPNFNKPVYYSNEIAISKYFDPKSYTTLNSVLRHMNSVNDNRALSLYRITAKRYVGIIATMKGGTNLIKHKYTLLDKDDEINMIESRAYTSAVNERISSVGLKFFQSTSDVYKENAMTEIPGNINGIYVASNIPIRDEIRIRYDVDFSSNDSENAEIFYPEEIVVYLMTELTIDIITEETIQNSSYLARNENEYGKFTNISANGNLVVIGSDLNTYSNVIPESKSNKYDLWIRQDFIDAKAEYSIGAGTAGAPRKDTTFTINWDVPFDGYDEGLTDYIDLTLFDRIEKLEHYVNVLNNYYGISILKLNYKNHYAVEANSVGGLGGRRMWFAVNNQVMIKSDDNTRWWQLGNIKSHYGDGIDYNSWNGVYPKGASIQGKHYYLSPNNQSRPSSLLYSVYYTGGTEGYADNITISYVLNLEIIFTEEYLQRYHYSMIKYGCLFYYVRHKRRWRHLNTLYCKTSTRNPLRRSMSLVNTYFPDKIEIIDNLYLLTAKNRTSNLIKNNFYFKLLDIQYNQDDLIKYYDVLPMEISIDYSVMLNYYINASTTTSSIAAVYDIRWLPYFNYLEKMKFNQFDNMKEISDRITDISSMLIPNHIYIKGLLNGDGDLNLNFDAYQKDPNSQPKIRDFISRLYYKTYYYTFNQSFNAFDVNLVSNYHQFTLNRNILVNNQKGKNLEEIDLNIEDYVLLSKSNVTDLELVYKEYTDFVLSTFFEKLTCKIKFSESLKRIFGIQNDIDLDWDNPTFYLPRLPNYNILIPINNRENFGIHLQKLNSDINNSIIVGDVSRFEIFKNNFDLYSKFTIKDKIGKLYLSQNTLYNCIPEKGLIKKYTIPNLVTPDPSYNIFPEIAGSQVLQEYSYSQFGKTFSIFNNYAVIGTNEGKVIIQHLENKNAAKAIINSGSSNYSKFGSTLRSGKNIYINGPELNKLFILSNIPYYE